MSTADKPDNILVVRLGAMGDVIHALPAAASLKHSFPGSRVTWAIEPRWAPLLERNPYVDAIAEIDRRSFAALRGSLRTLRARRYALAVDFQGLIKSAVVAGLARPERIFGFHPSLLREPLGSLTYSHKIRTGAQHVVERNLELAAAAGANALLRAFPIPGGKPEGALPPGPFVLASPLAGWRGKQWPLESYASLAAQLESAGIPLVLNGPPASEEILRRVGGARCHISGLDGLIDATRRATAVVGVDSGPLHLAAALGRPGVAVYGPTDPARNGPYGGSFTVLRDPDATTTYKRRDEIDRSMRAIAPERVFQALRACLLEPRPVPSSS